MRICGPGHRHHGGKLARDHTERFWHKLALAWSCTVHEAKQRCTLEEFRSWQAYDQLEPFGEYRQDARIAVLACVIAEAGGAKKATIDQFMVGKFIDKTGPARPKQTVKQMAQTFANWARMTNAYRAQQRRKAGQQP